MVIDKKFRLYLYRLYYFSSEVKKDIVIYFKLFGFGGIDQSLRCLLGFHYFHDDEHVCYYDEYDNWIEEAVLYKYYSFSILFFNYNFKIKV